MLPSARATGAGALRRWQALWRLASSSSSAGGSSRRSSPRALTLEVRPGTGGAEAAAFAADLFRMYKAYVSTRPGWAWAEMAALPYVGGGGSSSGNSVGIRLAAALVSGPGAAAALAGEAGVHRVQRIPATESSGRTHTSAATVAVLEEEEVAGGVGGAPAPATRATTTRRPRDAGLAAAAALPALDPATVRIDTFRSSGAGGQHVNTTDSAVRAVHLPSGIAIVARGDRSQHKNRAAALAGLAARVGGVAVGQAAADRARTRKAQVGTGDRSARVRTYNLVRGRVTDHRTGVEVRDVAGVLSGRRLGELLLDGGKDGWIRE